MAPEKDYRIRFGNLDDVADIRELAGENEIRTRYLHEAVRSERQRIVVLEENDKIKGFIKIRLTDKGIKIDDFALPEDESKARDLLSTVEVLPNPGYAYLYISPENKVTALFQDFGYEEELQTDDGKFKMVKSRAKIMEDLEKEKEYHEKVEEVEKRYQILQPRTVYGQDMLEKNLEQLEKIKEEIEGEESDKVKCTECEEVFDSEKGMKIHRTKVHGKD